MGNLPDWNHQITNFNKMWKELQTNAIISILQFYFFHSQPSPILNLHIGAFVWKLNVK